MTVLAFVIFLAAVAVMVVVHVKTQKRLAQTMLDHQQALEDQRVAQYKQAKAFQKELAISDRGARKLADQARKAIADTDLVREDTRALQQTLNAALSDPRVQRLLNKAGE